MLFLHFKLLPLGVVLNLPILREHGNRKIAKLGTYVRMYTIEWKTQSSESRMYVCMHACMQVGLLWKKKLSLCNLASACVRVCMQRLFVCVSVSEECGFCFWLGQISVKGQNEQEKKMCLLFLDIESMHVKYPSSFMSFSFFISTVFEKLCREI